MFTCDRLRIFVVPATGQQCPASVPTITSSARFSDNVCRQSSLSYTCNNDGAAISWASSVWTGSINVSVHSGSTLIPALSVTRVTLTESHNNNATCIDSTLTFTGSLTSLAALNGVVLNCSSSGELTRRTRITTIMVQSKKCADISA